MFKGSKNAFTLAEVLITLGIIGVVAAMTMPTLLNSTQAARSKTGFKKVMNVLNQALVVNFALEDFDASSAASGTGDASLYKIFMDRTNVMKTDTSDSNYTLYFNDGMVFSFPQDAANCGQITIGANNVKTKNLTNCKGFINTIPRKEGVKSGTETKIVQTNGRVKTEDIGNIWSVVIDGDKVLPNTKAAEAVMYNK